MTVEFNTWRKVVPVENWNPFQALATQRIHSLCRKETACNLPINYPLGLKSGINVWGAYFTYQGRCWPVDSPWFLSYRALLAGISISLPQTSPAQGLGGPSLYNPPTLVTWSLLSSLLVCLLAQAACFVWQLLSSPLPPLLTQPSSVWCPCYTLPNGLLVSLYLQ